MKPAMKNLTGFTCVPHLLAISPTYLPSEVFLQDSRNPDGSEAGDICCRTWPGPFRASSTVVPALGLARFRIPGPADPESY